MENFDVVVCGGGLAGVCAAITAARNGARTCILQDRPVFGGNSSSEIRVFPQGAANYNAYARETGIIAELLNEERAVNHEPNQTNGRTKDIGKPVSFRSPDWAVHYDNPDLFYKGGRIPYDPEGGYWWIELGVPWNTITENESIRHELTRHVFGIWDYMKNKDPDLKEKAATYALDWIGQVPGKRESRRIMGEYMLTETDLLYPSEFEDEIAYGGWYIDLHKAGGLL
ncbi:FAD-dependent oxidoreductase, partial [Paenibacillus sp. TAF58]